MKIKIFFLFFILGNVAYSQCIDPTKCLSNGIYSTNLASKIGYDNFVSGFHQTVVKQSNNTYVVWGETMANNGSSAILTPQVVSSSLYPALTGTILTATMGGNAFTRLVILTTDGLFVVGSNTSNPIFATTILNSSGFTKLTINGKTDGLPTGVSPGDVKMLFATNDALVVTTCAGSVYVLSKVESTRGFGIGTGTNANQWYQVQKSAGVPLTNIIVARGGGRALYALDANNELWTWGQNVFLGDGTGAQTLGYATQMTKPATIGNIKMIQANSNGTTAAPGVSYYILGQNGLLFGLGNNGNRQLGDFTTTLRQSWVSFEETNGVDITNVKWISANEHNGQGASTVFPAMHVLTGTGKYYNSGINSTFMLGRPVDGTIYDPGTPSGIGATDVIVTVEAGGHTSMVYSTDFGKIGYVGHRVSGSMGDGTSVTANEVNFNFTSTPVVDICGIQCNVELISVAGSDNQTICIGSPILNIGYEVSGANITGVTVTGLPAGVSHTYNALTGIISISGTPVANGIYNYSISPTGGCSTPTATGKITVNSPVTAGTLSGNQNICLGTTSTFTSTVSGGTWTSSNTAVATINSTTGEISVVSAGTSTMTYTINGMGCPNATATRDAIVTNCDTCPDYTCKPTGINAPNFPNQIQYDYFVSGFHQSVIKQSDGVNFEAWGEYIANNGSGSILTPTNIKTLYPTLTGTILYTTMGGLITHTLVILTSDGLFAVGGDYGYNRLFSSTIMPNATFRKLTINGKTDGLPTGVSPADVKMMFGTGQTLVITTCNGNVYVLSQNANVRGNGATGNDTTWSKVQKSAGVDLENIIVCRGAGNTLYALDWSGNLWTWGLRTYLGDGSAVALRNFATKMTLPVAGFKVKMIQATSQGPGSPAGGSNIIKNSYYALGQDKTLFALGDNTNRQLGDFTTTERTSWVSVKKPDNTNHDDAVWISAQEHDGADLAFSFYGALSVITSTGKYYTNGNSDNYLIGRGNVDNANPGVPTGINASDVITICELGGHTSMVLKENTGRLGYVGHRINGSMGDGSTADVYESTYNFTSTPIVSLCGFQESIKCLITNPNITKKLKK